MRNPKAVILVAGIVLVVMIVAGFLALNIYTGSKSARESLLTQYFRAYAARDAASLAELTGEAFTSDLGIESLDRGRYELYELATTSEGALRFILILDGSGDSKRAIVADMHYVRTGFSNLIESMRLVDQGRQLRE